MLQQIKIKNNCLFYISIKQLKHEIGYPVTCLCGSILKQIFTESHLWLKSVQLLLSLYINPACETVGKDSAFDSI